MLSLSRKTVRQSWPPYAGAFVALAGGVALISVAVTLGGAIAVSAERAGVTAAERTQLDDLAAMVGMMSVVALFMAMFVVASTFGFVIAARQRELGLLRLVGATPRQVRRMVLGESVVVAVLATIGGLLLATIATPAFVALLESKGLLAVELTMPAPWISWSASAGAGILVALLGSWRASRRASRVEPVAALREAALERRRPTVVQIVVGTICLAGSVALFLVASSVGPLFALVCGILVPEVVVIGLVCFGRVLFPWLGGLLARPFARRDVAARLARDHVRTGARTPAAVAAPILAISAVAGSMMVSLDFGADWSSALDRARLHAPLVVETAGDPAVAPLLTGDPEVELADQRVVIGEHEVVDVRLAREARGLHAVRGSLDDLGDERVAVTETYAMDEGVGVGDAVRLRVDGERVRAEVAAIVSDAPDLYADVLVPPALGGERADRVVPDLVFVDPGTADVEALLAGTSATVLTSEAWIDQVDAQTRANNRIGLWVLLGPAGLYAGIAIVNSVLIGVSQRRRQLRTVSLLGATDDQLRRMAIWEAGLVGGGALLLGGLVTGFVGWLIRHASTRDVADVGLTIPWLPLAAIAATCLGLAVAAALAGARAASRQS
ncbi:MULTISPECIES: FtsX-like permease family protein [unclassified Nocardioides]|uniref:FtsX-like permease family protein n=1 Tax=unclassified Nocardioides TaxID=2615069 RepID=UPI00360A514F